MRLNQRFLEKLSENIGSDILGLKEIENGVETNENSLRQVLTSNKILSEVEYQKVLADYLGISFVDKIGDLPTEFSEIFTKKVPYRYVTRNLFIPYDCDDDFLYLAGLDSSFLEISDEIASTFGKEAKAVISTENVIMNSIQKLYGRGDGEQLSDAFDEENDFKHLEDINLEEAEDLLNADDEEPIKKLVNSILYRSIRENASDVHIDPTPLKTQIRNRIDGMLYSVTKIPRYGHLPLVNRIKVMAGLDISTKNKTQDGRALIRIGGKKVDVRVSVVPTVDGERIVMRLLLQGHGVMPLMDLGLNEYMSKRLRELLQQPNGIILVTGPTGSGKSTTLYASLQQIDEKVKNIVTIEDPVEYQIPGYGQVQVNEKVGLTFAAGLRSILRQDPDVIMVGEIRDGETATIAIQAALTGHMVLSTLHANDSSSSIVRLIDMGIESFLISSTIRGVIAQRLIRRLCASCKIKKKVSWEDMLKVGVSEDEHQYFQGYVYESSSCEECRNTGYSGRIGIYEFMFVNEAISACISSNSTVATIKKVALENGLITLKHDCVKKIFSGETNFEEMYRIIYADSF